MKRLLLLTTLLSLTSPGLLHADNNVDPEAAVTITGDHVVVNDDDWNNDQIWDKLQGPNPNQPHQPHDENDYENGPLWGGREPSEVAPEPKLVKFTVTAIPTGGTGELTVSQSGGSVTLWKEPNKITPFVLPVKSDQTSVTLWVEGLEPTASFNEAGFDATYVVTGKDRKTATATAKIRYGITRADTLVDSNNSNSFDGEDEQIEFFPKAEHPGKILLENIGDVDNDGITDNLDGLGLASIGGSSHVENLKLIPMKVKLESPYKPSRATVTFEYSASIPNTVGDDAGIEKEGEPTNGIQKYKIKKRGLRLWKSINKDQSKLFHRSNGNNVTTPDGQFIPANTPIPWTALAPAASAGAEMAREITIYVEYVDLPTNKTYSKEDIIYTIKETNVPENEKGYYLDSLEKKTYLTEKESPDGLCVSLLPVDLDIVHPVTGELADAKEDVDDGGYVSVQRLEDPADATSDVTPKTKLKIHAISGAQSTWKTRLKFNGADRYKIYRDEARTQEVVSEQTEFDANQDTTLFFHGLKKSLARGGEQVTMQVKINDAWVDGDSVKCTIVQSEFLIQVKAFIPYAWTEAEEITGPDAMFNPMEGRVAKGDLHPGYGDRPASPSFINKYSTDFSRGSTPSYKDFQNAPFRVCQTVIVTPYKELHATSDIHGERNLYTAPLSETFEKATSVNAAEMHLKMGFMGLSGAAIKTGKPPELHENYDHENRTANRVAEVTIEGGGKDGAIPALGGVIPTAWAAADIHWRLYLKIWCDLDPLKPKVEFGGSHDSYPAYEIIVIQSDGNFKDIHRVSPAAGAMPGPNSLGDGNAINVGRTDTITE